MKLIRFLKMLKAPRHQSPRVINVDRSNAYPSAVEELKKEGVLPVTSQLRQCRYLNNLIEQDHRFIKRRVRHFRWQSNCEDLIATASLQAVGS